MESLPGLETTHQTLARIAARVERRCVCRKRTISAGRSQLVPPGHLRQVASNTRRNKNIRGIKNLKPQFPSTIPAASMRRTQPDSAPRWESRCTLATGQPPCPRPSPQQACALLTKTNCIFRSVHVGVKQFSPRNVLVNCFTASYLGNQASLSA